MGRFAMTIFSTTKGYNVATIGPFIRGKIRRELYRLYGKFAAYLRRVLCKTRLIFPRINGPSVSQFAPLCLVVLVLSLKCIFSEP